MEQCPISIVQQGSSLKNIEQFIIQNANDMNNSNNSKLFLGSTNSANLQYKYIPYFFLCHLHPHPRRRTKKRNTHPITITRIHSQNWITPLQLQNHVEYLRQQNHNQTTSQIITKCAPQLRKQQSNVGSTSPSFITELHTPSNMTKLLS